MPVTTEYLSGLSEKFFKFVDKNGPIHPVYGQCWQWTIVHESSRYSNLSYRGKNYSAHRWSWLLSRGYMTKLFVCHKCDNPRCVNPDHLFEGTHRDNTNDMLAKGRSRHKLTDDQRLEIHTRIASGEPRRKLAKEFGLSNSYISVLMYGKCRK